MLSLASCPACILMDDELNILPTSSHVARIAPVPLGEDGAPAAPGAGAGAAAELRELVAQLADTQVRCRRRGAACVARPWDRLATLGPTAVGGCIFLDCPWLNAVSVQPGTAMLGALPLFAADPAMLQQRQLPPMPLGACQS